ncbi:MAG: ribonuclease HII [Bacteriovoracaceae bacterium]|nr:ribonuclease HII [Bacteriovoracaceae bacterium]
MLFDLNCAREFLAHNGKCPRNLVLAGCDEVGRGPLAGPVVGASVFLKISNCETSEQIIKDLCRKYSDLGVTDSKKLTPKKRQIILSSIGVDISKVSSAIFELERQQNYTLSFSVSEISNTLIDEINILNASLQSMKQSFEKCLKCSRDTGIRGVLLVDGNKSLPDIIPNVSVLPVVKGDSKSILIGLASIIAKEYRDRLMLAMDTTYPGYGFSKHAGYPTQVHRDAIKVQGVTPIHRKSFKGVKEFCLTGKRP